MPRLRSALIVLTALALVAAPAADAAPKKPKPPTRLWYHVKAGYEFTITNQTFHLGFQGIVDEHVTKGRLEVHTQRGEAPLVRRARGGDLSFGAIQPTEVVGRYEYFDWNYTARWNAPVAGSELNGCSTTSVTNTAQLFSNPQIHGLVSVRGGRFNNTLNSSAMVRYADQTGVVTCTVPCPQQLPGRPTARELTGNTCTFRPQDSQVGEAPLEYLPSGNPAILDALNAQHAYRLPRGFGKKTLSVKSSAKATYHGTGSRGARTVEIVDETITLDFKRCPGGGRRPC